MKYFTFVILFICFFQIKSCETMPYPYKDEENDLRTRLVALWELIKHSNTAITSYRLLSKDNEVLDTDYPADCNGRCPNTIQINNIPKFNFTKIKASFELKEKSDVYIEFDGIRTLQISGVTENDFSNSKTIKYIVVAEDKTEQVYEVQIIPVSNFITNIKFATTQNNGLDQDYIVGCAGYSGIEQCPLDNDNVKNVEVKMSKLPSIDFTNLIASFTLNDNRYKIKIGNIEQVSGITLNDFSNLVVYDVYAGDKKIESYKVTIIQQSNEAKIISFNFLPQDSPSTLTYNEEITNIQLLGTSIEKELPYGARLDLLEAEITFSPNSKLFINTTTDGKSSPYVLRRTDFIDNAGNTKKIELTVISEDTKNQILYTK